MPQVSLRRRRDDRWTQDGNYQAMSHRQDSSYQKKNNINLKPVSKEDFMQMLTTFKKKFDTDGGLNTIQENTIEQPESNR